MEHEKIKEIKKALECCSTLMNIHKTSEEQDNACNECPYRINDRCSWELDSDALAVINELESENKELIEANKRLINRISNATKEELLEFQEELSFERFIKGIHNEPI